MGQNFSIYKFSYCIKIKDEENIRRRVHLEGYGSKIQLSYMFGLLLYSVEMISESLTPQFEFYFPCNEC